MTASLSRVILRHIQRRFSQSLLFIIGVMIGVAMLVSIDIANNSAKAAFDISTDAIVGRATHEIVGGPRGFDEGIYTQLRRQIGWRDAAPLVTDFIIAENLNEQPLRVLGIDPFAEGPFRNYLTSDIELDTGNDEPNADIIALGRFLVEPNTVFIGERLATRYGLRPNDTIEVRYGDELHTLTVIGILLPDDNISQEALQSLLITDISTAQEILALEGRLTSIDLIIDADSPEGRAALEEINAFLPPSVSIKTATARTNAVGQMTEAFELNLTALSLLALVVGMFLVYNTVTFSVVQRRPIIGILRSLGVTRRQVFGLIIVESLLLSFIGSVLGLGLGIVLSRFTVEAVTQTVNDSYFTVTVTQLRITPFILLKGVSVGIGATLLATLLPAYEATTTPPTSVIRRSDLEQRTMRLVPYITLIGITAAIGGALLLTIETLLVSLIGVFALVIGQALLTVLATIILARLLQPITGGIGGLVGRMAPRSILRNISRTSIAITALMLAVSVIIGVTTMVGSFRITVQDWLSYTLQSDIFISQPNSAGDLADIPISREIIERVASVEGVESVNYVRVANVQSPDYDQLVQLNAIMSDISRGNRKLLHSVADYDTVFEQLIHGEGVLLSEVFANNRGIKWRDDLTLTLITENGPYEFPVLGIYQDFSSVQGVVLIGLENYRQKWKDDNISSLAANIEPNADLQKVADAIRNELAGTGLLVQSNRELRQAAIEIFDRTFAITGALNLLATIVAFIGILSALMALQIERRREIGIMRANGLTRAQLFRLTFWETGIMGGIAGFVAMPVGLILGIVLIYIINLRSFGWSLTLNLRAEFFLQAFAVALIAALLAGIYPAWKASTIAPVEAIRSE
ncbi:MAG: ABC transporter substrate-binding protein [Phototrophicales bacterium]|nr:MAG: ABC transporter substrate-binding protein [Phototrophicales bacterium]